MAGEGDTGGGCGNIQGKIVSGALSLLALLATTTGGIGSYFHTLGHYPQITGPIFIPSATIAMGVITLVLTVLAQMTINGKNKLHLGGMTIIIGFSTATIGITAAISLTEEYNVDERVSIKLKETMQGFTNGTDTTGQVDALQVAFQCCGAASYRDYSRLPHFTTGRVPTSCCITQTADCGTPPLTGKTFAQGCAAPLSEALQTAINSCTITLALLGAAMGTLWTSMMCKTMLTS